MVGNSNTKSRHNNLVSVNLVVMLVVLVALVGVLSVLFVSYGQHTSQSASQPQAVSQLTSPTPEVAPIDQTSSWKVYSSTFGYSIKYPPDWVMEAIPSAAPSGQPDLLIHSPNARFEPHGGWLIGGMRFDIMVIKNTSSNQFTVPAKSQRDQSIVPQSLSQSAIAYRRPIYRQVGAEVHMPQQALFLNCFAAQDADPGNDGTACAQLLSQMMATLR